MFTLVATLLLISINFMNVRNYGEFEFWFALIKVTAIVCFIIICLLAVFNIWQGARCMASPTSRLMAASCPTAGRRSSWPCWG